ncbi:MAG: replication factor C large subunit [archaeon]
MLQTLIEKYFPINFDEFIGNVEIVDNAKVWAQNWQDGKHQKPLLFYGATGSGKTCLAYLIAKQYGWQIFEMSAANIRDKETIEKIAGAATSNSSLFGTKRLILLDEIDALQSQDRGGMAAILSIIKEANNPVILTANDLYADKKLAPLRTACELKEFKKINYLSIAKKLREICSLEKIEADEEAIKELAKNCSGDFRSALLDVESLSPKITMEDVKGLGFRQRKEKIFSVLPKIFNGKNIHEIQDVTMSSEVSSEMLSLWVEENIPRQFDAEDIAKAFSVLSRADVFNGRIYRRQHYGFLKYSSFLATAGVGLSRSKDYHSWRPLQFPTILSSLSSSSSKRETRKSIAEKLGAKLHCSQRQATKDLYILQYFLEDERLAPQIVLYFKLDEKEIAFLLNKKADSKFIEKLMVESKAIEKKILIEKSVGVKQSRLFG